MQKKSLLANVCWIGLFYLSYCAWSMSRPADDLRDSRFNPFVNSAFVGAEAYEARAKEMRERLEFMTFTRERREATAGLINALQSQLNLNPFDGSLWRELLYLSDGVDLPDKQKEQLLHAALKLQKWNHKEHALLANRCVVREKDYSSTWESHCKNLLTNIPNSISLKNYLRTMRLDHQTLREAMYRFGISQAKNSAP